MGKYDVQQSDQATAAPGSSYALNSLEILEQLNRRQHWTQLVSQKAKDRLAVIARRSVKGIDTRKDWSWVTNMPTWTLEGLRREACKRLRILFKDYKGAVLTLQQYHDLDPKPIVGCILHLPPSDHPYAIENATTEPKLQDVTTTRVAQYELPTCPGNDSEMWELFDHSNLLQHHEYLVLLNHHRTLKVHLALNRLEGFLAGATSSEAAVTGESNGAGLVDKQRLLDQVNASHE